MLNHDTHEQVDEYTTVDRVVLTLTYCLMFVTCGGCFCGIWRFFKQMHHYNQVRV
jgi:hypothetical protein